jgi:hypothetical protein
MAKQKLTIATEQFTKAMRSRLQEKRLQGFAGWDISDFHGWNIPRRLHDKALNVLIDGADTDPVELVDIANFAMFLHWKLIDALDREGE